MALIRITKPLMFSEEIKELQQLLTKKGYDPGPVDGYYGQKTRAAVVSFQRDYKLLVDGIVGPQTWNALRQADNYYELKQWTKKYGTGRYANYHALILRRDRVKIKIIHGQEILPGMFKATVLSKMPYCPVRMSGPLFWDGRPLGPSVLKGKIINDTPSYPNQYAAISPEKLVLFKELTADRIANMGYDNIFSGTPPLVSKSKVEVGRTDKYLAQIHPRAGIGWNGEKIILLTVDGRTTESQGVYLKEFAEEFAALKAEYAVNLDGGGSAQLMLENRILNKPSDGKERPIVWGLGFAPAK